MTTKAEILLIAPELSSASDEQFNLAIAESAIMISSSVYGLKTETARRYYSAHCLTIWTTLSASAGGAVTSEKAGRSQIQYQTSSDPDWLGLTKYGRMLLSMRSARTGIFVV